MQLCNDFKEKSLLKNVDKDYIIIQINLNDF